MSKDPSGPENRTTVILTGWDAGFRTIDLMRVITRFTALGLVASKALVERVVAGATESLAFGTPEEAVRFYELARETGVRCRLADGDG